MRVPRLWTATIDDEPVNQAVNLNKFPLWVFSANKDHGWIQLGPWDFTRTQPTQRILKTWIAVFWTMHSADNSIVTGPNETKIDSSNSVICMMSVPRNRVNAVVMSCLLPQRRWKAEFIGEKTDEVTFWGVIRSLD